MKWPFGRRRKPVISIGLIQELVRREVERQLTIELSPLVIAEPTLAVAEFDQTQPPLLKTRKSKLVEALDSLGVERRKVETS